MAAGTPPLDIQALLELEPTGFAEAVESQSHAIRDAIRQEIEARLKTLDAAAWGGERKLRGHNRVFQNAKFDYEKIDQTQQWLAGQFHDAFNAIYDDPAEAAAKCWSHEQMNGTAETARILKSSPELFGRLKGHSFLGFQSPARRAARRHALKFDFAAYRLVFNLATQAGKTLHDLLKETARVANA